MEKSEGYIAEHNNCAGIGTKQKIIETCGRLFYERGYTAVLYDDICEKAEINRGLIHYHFKTKANIAHYVDSNLFKEQKEQIGKKLDSYPQEIISGYYVYSRIMLNVTDIHIAKFTQEYFMEFHEVEEVSETDDYIERKEFVRFMLQEHIEKYTEEELKRYICFWMGMQKYLAAAYTCGMFDFTGKELCEWILRFFYSFWGYEKNVIDKMIEEVKEVYQKYPVQADNGFHVHIMPEGTEPEDTVTEYVRENRKQFLEHYEEWEQKRNKKMSRKKKSIYEQCRHMFWENGYEKTTYKEISSTIKISQGLIAYHFGKKINIAYEIYEDCKRQKEEMIQKMKDMFSEEEDFKLGRLMRAYMLHIKGGEKYEKLLYGMMQEQEYFQLKLLEIESEARTIEKFNPDKPMLRRVIITVIHGIEDELIWKNFQKSYSNTKDGADMLEADVMIHNCLETDDIIIWYRKMIEDVKNYLEEWEITIEEDFILKCRKK